MRALLLAGLCALGVGCPAVAQEVKVTTYGKWEVGVGRDFVDAFTVNDQGQRFGINCSDECIGVVSPPYGCEQDDQSVALFNSVEGVVLLKLECVVYEGDALFAFEDNLSEAFKHNGEVGLAFPGIRATFATMRFSLDGAVEAYEHLRREFEKRPTKRTLASSS